MISTGFECNQSQISFFQFSKVLPLWFELILQNCPYASSYELKSLDQILQVHFKPLDKMFPRCIYPNSMGDLAQKSE